MRANQLTIVGCGLLALSMTGAIWLITGYLFGDGDHGGGRGRRGLVFAVLWYAVPLRRVRQQRR